MRALLVLVCLLSAAPARAQDVMTLIHAQHWAQADAAASGYADPMVGKLVAYYRMQTPGAATLGEVDAFRAKNPDWPQQAVLAQRREEALIAEPDDAVAASACQREPPHTASALARCADAYQRQNRPDDAAAAASMAWIAAPPNAPWEAEFLRRWAQILTPADQWARFDRLAWTDTSAALRQLQHLSPDDRRNGEARLALRRDDPKTAALLAGLSQKTLAEPDMMLERARWLRRANRDAEALALWQADGTAAERAAPADRRAAFWDERNLLARRLLRGGDAAGAYALASGAAQTEPEQVAEAEFLAGWIALRRLGDPARAATHFGAIELVSPAAITQGRAHYWLARAASAQGDFDGTQREDRVAAAYPSTFYGQLAARAAGEDTATLAARIAQRGREPAWTGPQATHFASRELARAAIYLAAWGEPGRASAFLLRLGDGAGDVADMALAARLATAFGLPQTAIAIARRAGRVGTMLLDTGWPLAADVPADSGLDPALTLAVIRQESSFDPAIISPAGARGLMQLMPGTAESEARELGLPVSVPALTADPGYNMRLGIAYLRGLLGRFDGATAVAVAAYNAGPTRVSEWLAQAGDPRDKDDAVAMTDWIEQIPFGETRNYVQRVIESTVIYRARLGEFGPSALPWQPSPA